MLTALLDTNVLWPSLQRDFLLSLSIEGLYRPLWSEVILAELAHAETIKLIKRGRSTTEAQVRSRHLVAQMRTHFPDAMVTDWESLEGTYNLPDPNDEHVVAAARIGGAGIIVTHNIRDFPRPNLPNGIDIQTPAEFAGSAVQLDPARSAAALAQIAARSGARGPLLTTRGVLDVLASRYKMTQVASQLEPFLT